MTVDPHGLLWLDNPLLVLGLLSLIWVLVATLHAEPWVRRVSDDTISEDDRPRTSPVHTMSRVPPLSGRSHRATALRGEVGRRGQAYRVTTTRR